jgi:hypothetical protein
MQVMPPSRLLSAQHWIGCQLGDGEIGLIRKGRHLRVISMWCWVWPVVPSEGPMSSDAERAALDALTIEHAHSCPSCCDQHCERAGALWERSEALLALARRAGAAATPRAGGANTSALGGESHAERTLREGVTHVDGALAQEITPRDDAGGEGTNAV